MPAKLIDKLRKKKGKKQITYIRNERGDITTDLSDIERTIKEYHKQLCAKKLDNPGEMDKFFKRCK